MTDRESIIAAVIAAAEAKNGRPPGQNRFEVEFGVSRSAWRAHWSTWRDVISAAGLTPPRSPQKSLSEDQLVRRLADLALLVGHYPTKADRQRMHDEDATYPIFSVYLDRLGWQATRAASRR